MTPEFVVEFARQSIELTLLISLPMLLVGLVVGLIVSIFQTATQIQDQILAFIPKILSMFAALLIAFPWIMNKMMAFTVHILQEFPTWVRVAGS